MIRAGGTSMVDQTGKSNVDDEIKRVSIPLFEDCQENNDDRSILISKDDPK